MEFNQVIENLESAEVSSFKNESLTDHEERFKNTFEISFDDENS